MGYFIRDGGDINQTVGMAYMKGQSHPKLYSLWCYTVSDNDPSWFSQRTQAESLNDQNVAKNQNIPSNIIENTLGAFFGLPFGCTLSVN